MKWMTKLGTGYSNSTGGLTGDLVDFIILSGWLQPEFQTEKAEVFTEKIDMSVVGTELHMGGRRCEEAPRRRDTMENYSEQSPYQCCSNGVIDSMVTERASGFV
jgi:hypothetical protein